MRTFRYALGLITLFYVLPGFASIPLLEFLQKPSNTQKIKPQQSSYLFYTLRNNTNLNLPLNIRFSQAGVSLITGTTCANSLAAKGTCNLVVQFTAPSSSQQLVLAIAIDYQGRAPLQDNVTYTIDTNIACDLLPLEAYQSSFCQNQYQNLLQFTPNVFNVNNKNVINGQTLGGVIGILRAGTDEEICYIRCGLKELNGEAPTETTMFEKNEYSKAD